MRKKFVAEKDDSTFELNLAPMLDIIVSIIPMLLLSVVFVRITMIETPIPQAVQKAMLENQKHDDVQISLAVSKDTGFKVIVVDKGATKETQVELKGNEFDLDRLQKELLALKQQYPNVFRIELNPDETLPLEKIVAVMDRARAKAAADPKIVFKDVDTGKDVETDLMFPDIVFGNVAGG